MIAMVAGALALTALGSVVVCGVREGLARATEDRASVGVAAALAVLAVLPAKLGQPFGSIVIGLLLTALLAAPFSLLWLRRRLRGPVIARRRTAADAWLLLSVLALFVLGAWCAWTTYLWDEDSTHFGVASSIARGVLPPVLPYFPTEPFRYHCGYDVLVALVRAFTGAPIEDSCDVVTTLCLAVLLAVLRGAGRALAGARGAALAVLLGLLGYSPVAMCLANGWSVPLSCSAWFPSPWVDARTMPPTVMSSFFQHPQGLGMLVSLAALLLALAPRDAAAPSAAASRSASTARVGAAALVLALCSQAQTVYAAMAIGGIGAALLGRFAARVQAQRALPAPPRSSPLPRAAGTLALHLAMLAAALAAPALLGGVLGAGALDAIHVGRGYFGALDAGVLAHNLVLFGATLVAVPLAWLRRRGPAPLLRLSLVAIAAVSFAVGNGATYERSWDIVKFFAVGAFFANLLLADLVAPLFSRARGVVLPVVGLAIVLASLSSALLWLVRHGPLNGVVAPAYTELPPDPVGVALSEHDGDRIGPRDLVLTTHDDIAQLGFLVAGHDWRKAEHGYLLDRDRVDRAHALVHSALYALDRAALGELSVAWIFLSERELRALQPDARVRLADGDGGFLTRVDDIEVSEIVRAGHPPVSSHWLLFRVERPQRE
ncbi:MAG TPA: hypothetical protein VGO62_12845 [Myxococcota bacterium]